VVRETESRTVEATGDLRGSIAGTVGEELGDMSSIENPETLDAIEDAR